MKPIFFLAHRIPYPPDRGDKIRSFNIVKRLALIAPVHIAAFADDAADAAHANALASALGDRLASLHVVTRRRSRASSLGIGLLTGRSASMSAFADARMRKHVTKILRDEDIGAVFAFSGQMGQYVPRDRDAARFIMDFVDVDSAKFDAYATSTTIPLSWLWAREAKLLAREETAIAARADISIFVTEAETEIFRGRAGHNDRLRTLTNGVDSGYFDPEAIFAPIARSDDAPLIVFTGQMNYAPNVAAVESFARIVMPVIRLTMPTVRFAIVGRGPSSAVRKLGRLAGVDVIGTVPDTRSWLAAADLVVAPLQIARGVQNKVLEAMAMARPVVASAAAFEGIDAEPGRDLLVAEGPRPIAKAILSILHDEELAHTLGQAARARVCSQYSWDRQLATLPELICG